MKSRPQRRFTLFDAMVLVAALALGFAQGRTWEWEPWHKYFGNTVPAGPSPPTSIKGRITEGTLAFYNRLFALGYPSLVTLTAAVLLLRFRGPRPNLRRLVRLPGFLACVFPCLILTANSIRIGLYLLCYHLSGEFVAQCTSDVIWGLIFYDHNDKHDAPLMCGAAIGSIWLSLLIAGRWKTEQDWIDRHGRVLGVFWISLPLVIWWVTLLQSY